MGEQRFKVGDWVRRVEPSDWPEQYGVVDGIYKVLKVGRYGIAVTVGADEADATSFEPWQPRVGERVRVINSDVVSHWNEFWAIENGVKLSLGDFVYVTKVIPNYLQGKAAVEITAKQNGSGPRWLLDKFEPILATATTATPEQPATLKIEAGLFYKTRDGRKVGPMAAWHRGGWASEGEFKTGLWLSDGQPKYSNASDSPALIAEWIDEPAAKASTSTPSNDNAKPKFKVGDRVKSVEKGPTGGYLGVIIEDDESVVPFLVAFDDWDEGHGSADNEWWLQESEIIAAPSTTTIVALIENGKPKPSSTPFVHSSTGAAETEAKRLAGKHKGKKFGVFTLTTTHEEAAPVYDHKWKNMAALGLKIDAIKELRAVAGLDLLSAKRAVEAFEQAA